MVRGGRERDSLSDVWDRGARRPDHVWRLWHPVATRRRPRREDPMRPVRGEVDAGRADLRGLRLGAGGACGSAWNPRDRPVESRGGRGRGVRGAASGTTAGSGVSPGSTAGSTGGPTRGPGTGRVATVPSCGTQTRAFRAASAFRGGRASCRTGTSALRGVRNRGRRSPDADRVGPTGRRGRNRVVCLARICPDHRTTPGAVNLPP